MAILHSSWFTSHIVYPVLNRLTLVRDNMACLKGVVAISNKVTGT